MKGLLARAGVPDGSLILGSFSAGHEIAKPALMEPADRALVRAVMLADSTYTSWANQATRTANPPEGYVRYALDAATAPDKLFVATASSYSQKYPSGVEGMAALRAEVEKRSGLKFDQVASMPGVVQAPRAAWRLGNVWLADYGGEIAHPAHASVLAPQVWQGILMPSLAGSPEGPPVGITPGEKVAWFLFGVGVGYGAFHLARKQMEKRG